MKPSSSVCSNTGQSSTRQQVWRCPPGYQTWLDYAVANMELPVGIGAPTDEEFGRSDARHT